MRVEPRSPAPLLSHSRQEICASRNATVQKNKNKIKSTLINNCTQASNMVMRIRDTYRSHSKFPSTKPLDGKTVCQKLTYSLKSEINQDPTNCSWPATPAKPRAFELREGIGWFGSMDHGGYPIRTPASKADTRCNPVLVAA